MEPGGWCRGRGIGGESAGGAELVLGLIVGTGGAEGVGEYVEPGGYR